MNPSFKAGFVSIVGKPNVGKSTLMNKLIGEQLSIATPKAQTTRHRIMGILNFSPILLHVPEEVMVNNVNLAIELENLSYFIQD